MRANIVFKHTESGQVNFSWRCPDCNGVKVGVIGDAPVGGWDGARWRLTGTEEAPTLRPSLGCFNCMTGEPPRGHYWCNDGELVRAPALYGYWHWLPR